MLLFDSSTLGTANNQIVFGDDTSDPYYRIKRVRVLNRQVVDFDIKIPNEMGVADFETLMGKANLILEGTMYPGDEASYDEGIKSLRKLASMAISQDDASSDQGYVPWAFTEYDGYDKQINLKVEYIDLPQNTTNGLKQPFRLFCKVKYPAILSQTTLTATIGSSTATTSGSANLSFTLPRALGLTTYSSSGSINNPGHLPIYPSITIFGPITSPRITNATSGEYIELTGLSLASGANSAIITYDQDSLSITADGSSVLDKLTNSSTLFKLDIGINTLTLTGATVGSGAYAQVTAIPAWPLS